MSAKPVAGVGVGKPNAALIYDYLLGGKDYREADRQAAESLLELVPDASVACYDNRQFLGRAVRYLVGTALAAGTPDRGHRERALAGPCLAIGGRRPLARFPGGKLPGLPAGGQVHGCRANRPPFPHRQLICIPFRIPVRNGTPRAAENAQDVARINLPVDSQANYVHSS